MPVISKSFFSLAILNNGARDFIKLIAAVLMVLDHMAFAGMIDPVYHNIFGRGVYPIFAYSLGCFLATNPQTVKKYLVKMAVFAVTTQPIYYYFMTAIKPEWMALNILFTLFFAMILGRVLLTNRIHPLLLHGVIIVFLLGSGLPIPIEYKLAGIILPVLFALVLQGKRWATGYLMLAFLMLNAPEYNMAAVEWCFAALLVMLYAFVVFSASYATSPLLAEELCLRKRFLNRYFLYVFYPLHIMIIALII